MVVKSHLLVYITSTKHLEVIVFLINLDPDAALARTLGAR